MNYTNMNLLYPLKTEAAKSSKSLISDETENKVETLKPDGERRAEMRQSRATKATEI